MAYLPGVLAAELVGGKQMVLYTRDNSHEQPFSPWLLVETPEEAARSGFVGVSDCVSLKGGGEFRARIHFHNWSHFLAARDRLAQDGIPHFNFNNPVRQHLTLSGQTLFRGMRYGDLHRLQLDIETLTLDPSAPDAQIILISISDSRGFETVLSATDMSEADLLRNLNKVIHARNSDTIEGHNIFEFDLPYLVARAQHYGISLTWGRDGSALRAGNGQRVFKVGAQIPGFRPAYVHGRHIIDTLQQVQRYDTGGKLERYGLKQVIHALGLERPGRTFVDGEDIAHTWRTNPQRLIDYALDDVRDAKTLSEVVVPTEFYQTQILPYGFQDAALSGPGEKINALMVGLYLRRNLAIPRPRPSKGFSGGYTRLVASGIFKRVVKADVESLYPSIMLTQQIHPVSDTENAFLPMLEHLTQRRLEAKTNFQSASDETDRAYWNGLQSSYKILINSFYGYLAYGRACFNDYHAAQKITEMGQQIARQLVAELRDAGGKIIEVDTDGAYFVAPSHVKTEADEKQLIEEISGILPRGIHLSHDGRFKGMVSLKAKNYILVDYNGGVSLVGSSLRSRRDARIFRQFIAQIAPLLVNGDTEAASRAYLSLGRKLQDGKIDPEDFCRFERITKKTFFSPNLSRLATAAKGCRIGERIAVYQCQDGSLSRAEFFTHDEDRGYLLRRLHDMAERFRVLFTDSEFRRLFPLIQSVARDQLCLF